MCKVKILTLEDSVVCENAVNFLKNKLGSKRFETLVEILPADLETLNDLDEKYGVIKGFPTFILEKKGEAIKLMGGDPNTLEEVIKFLENCEKKT